MWLRTDTNSLFLNMVSNTSSWKRKTLVMGVKWEVCLWSFAWPLPGSNWSNHLCFHHLPAATAWWGTLERWPSPLWHACSTKGRSLCWWNKVTLCLVYTFGVRGRMTNRAAQAHCGAPARPGPRRELLPQALGTDQWLFSFHCTLVFNFIYLVSHRVSSGEGKEKQQQSTCVTIYFTVYTFKSDRNF